MYASAHPDDPCEIFPNETVRCGDCGHITDWYEAVSSYEHHYTEHSSWPIVRTPRVLNKKTDNIPPDAIYVGRPSKWGNPYKIGRDGSRTEVIELYRHYLAMANLTHTTLDLNELKGKDLVCWCAPLPCHADKLLELANRKR